jgi:ribosomal protein S18 acetylase RimI-like enzyme
MALKIASIADGDVDDVVDLWELCGLTRPWNDPRTDIALARRGPGSELLVGRNGDGIVASVMVGADGHRGWIYYVAVRPDCRGRGYGRLMMRAAERWAQSAGVPKIQLMVRGSNAQAVGFYRTLGYLQEDTLVLGKRFDGRAWTVAEGPST